MADKIGLTPPPAPGATALVPGTFDGVAVFVTGGGTGLGKAIAAEFARLGASLVVASRKPEHLEAAAEAISALGAPVTTVACDIRDPEAIAAAFDAAEEAYGLPGVLINNAAANFPVPAEDMSPNAWRTVVDITLNGTFFCAREFGRRHLAAGTPASMVNIAASYAWTGGPGFAHSAAAKAGVVNLTETLAVEWGPYGIQVNALVPGLFPHEDMTADITGSLDRTHDKDVCQPALRVGQRQELGWAATFLASLQLVERLSTPANASAAQTINSALSGGFLMGIATIGSGWLYDQVGAKGYLAMAAMSLPLDASIHFRADAASIHSPASVWEPSILWYEFNSARTAFWLFPTIEAATRRAVGSSSSCGTTSVTSPARSASAADR